VAPALIENATVRDIERRLAELGAAAAEPGQSVLRTHVLTHLAWVPPEWEAAARSVLDNLGDRHPSRTILFLPDRASPRDALDAEVDLRSIAYGGPDRSIYSEEIAIWLRGRCAEVPASVAQPLLVSDLPVFLRWRGSLPFGSPELEGLVGVANRLVVDSSEWSDPDAGFGGLGSLFPRIAVSDIAWARLEPWRRAVAALWPAVASAEQLTVHGPRADAILLARWLGSRLGHAVVLVHEPAAALEAVDVDGRLVAPDRDGRESPSDLLSAQLEIYGRDSVYEEAVSAR